MNNETGTARCLPTWGRGQTLGPITVQKDEDVLNKCEAAMRSHQLSAGGVIQCCPSPANA